LNKASHIFGEPVPNSSIPVSPSPQKKRAQRLTHEITARQAEEDADRVDEFAEVGDRIRDGDRAVNGDDEV
jgi:hypothetical protein